MKTKHVTIGLVLLALVMLLLLPHGKANGQDNPITVCRDPRFFNPIRIEFHNIPLNFFVWNSDAPSWGYWAMGVGMYTKIGVMVADALDVDTDGYKAGTATLVVYGDHPYSVEGNADTPLCDVSQSPVQDDMPIVLTPEPTDEPAPISSAGCFGGQTFAVNHSNGATLLDSNNKPYCYMPSSSGVVGIPPAT